jgi:hypothetical protein
MISIDEQIYKIHHKYDIGNQAIYISSKTDPTKAAIFCQFMAEKWFGEEHDLSNLAIANALVSFYDCSQAAVTEKHISINIYYERNALCGSLLEEEKSLHRTGLKFLLEPHTKMRLLCK